MENNKQWWWNNGFYDTKQEGCHELTQAEVDALVEGERNGKIIVCVDGRPELQEYAQPTEAYLAQHKIVELTALLCASDYKVTKNQEYIAAGVEPHYDAVELYTEREFIRDQIRKLENNL